MPGKTFIACRPGKQQAMQAAFAGLDVVVDDALTVDYEFRERDMTFEEILEEETVKAEKVDLDPRDAITVIVPMDPGGDLESAGDIDYVVIRSSSKTPRWQVVDVVRKVAPSIDINGDMDAKANMSAIKAALKKDGIEVHSVSLAAGLTWMDI